MGKPRFYARRDRELAKRLVFDLQFWRRFVSNSPKGSFSYFLDQLPVNSAELFSDASSSWGMSGVILFRGHDQAHAAADGLFWQSAWEEWVRIKRWAGLIPGDIQINTAEFIAALITCETFAEFCIGKFTRLYVDNVTASSWLNNARCPKAPFDRCAQGVHLQMVQLGMKVKSYWLPSSENKIADVCSRMTLQPASSSHTIHGARLLKVKPKWSHLTRFL